jgi:molybdopterin-guanine dinucleotide biosynthesis protein A
LSDPFGAVVAGGRSRRYGSPKTLAEFGGKPLIWHPIEALMEAFGSATVVCKPDTPLPELPDGAEVLYEQDPRAHPLVGIVEALRSSGERRLAVLGCDMPAVTASLMRRLAEAGPATVVAKSPGGIEPLAAVYAPAALAQLEDALAGERSLRDAVASLAPVELEVAGAEVANVNIPGDLRAITT